MAASSLDLQVAAGMYKNNHPLLVNTRRTPYHTPNQTIQDLPMTNVKKMVLTEI